MSQNVVTKGTFMGGDVLVAVGKLAKAIKFRIGTGGTAISGSTQVVTPQALPSQALVIGAFVNVLAASTGATKTFSIGTSNAGTGLLSSVSAASTGIVTPSVATSTGAYGTGLISSTFGTFLATFVAGVATSTGSPGVFVPKTYGSDSTASRTLTFTPDSTDWIAFSADVYVEYFDLTL